MSKERVAKWDNLKLFAIMCVVIGHSLFYFNGFSDVSKSIYIFIYTFHMPVFIFIAGYFAVNAINSKRYESVIEYALIYVIIKFLQSIGDYIAKGKFEFHFMWEDGPAWFALAIGVFILATILLKNFNMKYVLIIAIFIGCVAGLDTHFGNHYASKRICVFYPVFIAGYYIKSENIDLKNIIGNLSKFKYVYKIVAAIVLILVAVICFKYADQIYPYINFLKAKTAYAKLGIGYEGVLLRLANYALWAILIAAIIELTPRREFFWTWLGTRTMSTFIWHYLVIILLAYPLHGILVIRGIMPNYYVVGVIIIAMIISVVTAYLPAFKVSKKLK